MNKIKLSMVILGVGFIVIWLSSPIEYLLSFTNDDSYFYLKTALNFAKQGESTFDGINLTNGYHPFWFIVVSIIFKISLLLGINSENLLLRIVFILITFINTIILIIVNKAFDEHRIKNKNSVLILSVLLLIPLVLFYQLGLETQAFVLFFLIGLIQISKFVTDSFNKKLRIQISITLSILFLCRVDLFWYVLITILFYIFVKNKNLFLEFLKMSFLPLVIFFIYVFMNKIIFNTYYPISSYYKLSFDTYENLKFFPTPLKNPIDFSVLFLILSLKLISIYLNIKNKIHRNILVDLLVWSNFAFIFFLVVNFFINSNGVREWYYTFPMFTTVLFFSVTFSKHKLYSLILVTFLIINVFYFAIFRINYYNHKSAYNYALELKKYVDDQSIIYQVDYSGLISFFSGKMIINGDGLINSYEYYEYVKTGRIAEYLEKYKPKYLSFYSFENPFVNDKIKYKFKVIKNYQILVPSSNLILRKPFLYGGIFRRKYGNFYLLKLNEYKIITN